MAKEKLTKDFYRSGRWLRLRERILRRDGYMCQISRRYGRMVQATTVHHILPMEEYPEYAYAPWNLISLSAAAHDRMHDRMTGDLTDDGRRLQERIAREHGIQLHAAASRGMV